MPKDIRSLSIAMACALLLLSGCDWLRPGGPPDKALVELSSEDVDKAALVLSQNFVWAPDPGCDTEACDPTLQVVTADTTIVDLPYSRTVKFTSRYLLLAQSYPVDQVEAKRLAMRIAIDGQEKYSDYRSLSPPDDEGLRQTLHFVYTFGGRPLTNGGVEGG
jgi:hypothetical protein